jgi:hypothetical protein
MTARRQVWAATIAVTALALSACGGDDDDSADETTPTTATADTGGATTDATTTAPSTTGATTTTGASTTMAEDTATETTEATGEAASSEFCSTVIEAETIASAGPDVDFEAATEEEIAGAMEEFSAVLLPLLDDLAGSVPDEISGDVETIDAALRTSMETGDDPFSQPGFVEADRAVDEYVANNCGYDVYTVRAVEYEFEDVPATIETGIVGFELENEGEEVHELVMFRINDDVDLTIEELAELPEEESESMVEFITATFAAPGESAYTFGDLRPGRYGMLCFIPVGTTDMSMLEEPTDDGAATTTEATGETTETTGAAGEMGPPHFTQGMMAEFEVTEAGGGSDSSPTTTDGSDSSPTTTDDSDSSPSTTDDSDSSEETTTTTTG